MWISMMERIQGFARFVDTHRMLHMIWRSFQRISRRTQRAGAELSLQMWSCTADTANTKNVHIQSFPFPVLKQRPGPVLDPIDCLLTAVQAHLLSKTRFIRLVRLVPLAETKHHTRNTKRADIHFITHLDYQVNVPFSYILEHFLLITPLRRLP